MGRVGLEATGGYERKVRQALEQAGFEVVVHQPIEVRRFAQLKRRRAKNDRLDAQLIAAATAQVEAVKAAQDPRLLELAERLTAYEQISDQAAELKTFLDSVTLKDVAIVIRAQIRTLTQLKAKLAADILRCIKAEPDLQQRLRLLLSLPGVGPIVGATLVVRMPELGSMDRGQAASLAGVAPFDRDSGQWKGLRFICARSHPAQLYLAALHQALQPNPQTFADQLLARSKPKKLVVVAIIQNVAPNGGGFIAPDLPPLGEVPAKRGMGAGPSSPTSALGTSFADQRLVDAGAASRKGDSPCHEPSSSAPPWPSPAPSPPRPRPPRQPRRRQRPRPRPPLPTPAVPATVPVSAEDLKAGMTVKDPAGAIVGPVTRVGKTADGKDAVLVNIDGKDVGLPASILSKAQDGSSLVSSATKDQILAAAGQTSAPGRPAAPPKAPG